MISPGFSPAVLDDPTFLLPLHHILQRGQRGSVWCCCRGCCGTLRVCTSGIHGGRHHSHADGSNLGDSSLQVSFRSPPDGFKSGQGGSDCAVVEVTTSILGSVGVLLLCGEATVVDDVLEGE